MGKQTPERPLTQEEYSALTESEKAKVDLIPQLKNELQQIKNQNNQQQLMASIKQNDISLKG